MKRRKFRQAMVLFLLLAVSLTLTGPERAFAYTVGDDGEPVHEYIADQARALYSNAEIDMYISDIQSGAEHEDLLDIVWDNYGFAGACTTSTHFWNADAGPGDPVSVGGCHAKNAYQKAVMIWGMAVGEYRSGDLASAYHYLGHISHLLADMSLPVHAHEEAHGPEPFDDDSFEDWMGKGNEILTASEKEVLAMQGKVEIPENVDPLYYLFYTTNQFADFFADDANDGDTNDPEGWMSTAFDWMDDNITSPRTDDDLSDNDNGDDNDDGDLGQIREISYKYAIRAVASLYEIFYQEASTHSALTVVIEEVLELNDTEGDIIGDHADFYVEVEINGFEYRNEGKQIVNTDHITPGWAFGRNVGVTGTIPIVIQLWDEDEDPNPDDPSPIDPVEGRNDLDLFVNLETGVITEQESGSVLGNCGDLLVSEGHPNDDDRSRIWYRVLLPNIPPDVDAGDDLTVNEGDDVTLSGTFTDPNAEDTWTYLWHLESSSNGQSIPNLAGSAVPNTPIEFTFTPWDNGEYIFSLTVTDNYEASDTDIVVVTVLNVPPEVYITSLTDELGAEIGVDVPVALVGLEVNLEGSFTDAGWADTHIAAINWDDGSIDPHTTFNQFVDCTGGLILGYVHATHIYNTPGNFEILLAVTDDDWGVGTATVPIEIVDASGAIEIVVENLEQYADIPDIQAALDKLLGENEGDASGGALDMLEKGNLNAALEKFKQALEYMEAAEAADPNLDLTYDKHLLALAAKSVVVVAINEAALVADKQSELNKIQEATDLVAAGDALLTSFDYVGAVEKYQEAVRKVQNIN